MVQTLLDLYNLQEIPWNALELLLLKKVQYEVNKCSFNSLLINLFISPKNYLCYRLKGSYLDFIFLPQILYFRLFDL